MAKLIIAKELEWMRDYISSVEYLVPKAKYVRRISIKKSTPDRKQHIVGIIHYVDKKHFRICLYATYHSRSTGKIAKYNCIDMLHTLAHELSHLLTFEHTPERMMLECDIMKVFMAKLKTDGYISEEYEERNGNIY